MGDEKGAKETSNEAAKLNELQNYKKDGHALKFFAYASIMEATDSFSSNNKLGQGGFGHVYMGKLHDGKEVAIKRLSRSSRQGVTEFTNELTLISELQHRNLVQLLGCCIEGEERILIYEFMPNKSLDFFLFG
ncbi:G-type lectin S-receptor-like serine/threonine-protein kinase At1g61480 [Neltuma alba]|uniref:G-type lectin S-receptor-like serine/threonine-protein kinase At1g61480 n=1 Tax=Neltuma alba TaxID=207710 RepID=UPI0010A40246|nr:G-type lectin S-receptor-like serine/threonine-protein kinase At1g61480 [Prosopis alba]